MRIKQRLIMYGTVFGMEACCLYLLSSLLNKEAAGGQLSVITLLALYPLGLLFNLGLRRIKIPKLLRLIIPWLVWIPLLLVMVKVQLYPGAGWSDPQWISALPRAIARMFYLFQPEMIVLLLSGLLWFLGGRLAYLSPGFAVLVTEFQFGLALLFILFFVIAQLGTGFTGSVPVALGFFFLGLTGMSIAHAQEGTSWLSGLYKGRWVGLLLVSVGVIIGFGLLIGLLINPEFIQMILAALQWVWNLIMKVLTWIASLIPEPAPAEPLPPGMGGPAMPSQEPVTLWHISDFWRGAIRIVWTALVIGLILVSLWRISSQIFDWLRRKLGGMAGAEVEQLDGAFKADFISLLKLIWRRLLELVHIRRRKKISASPEIISVRQLYRQFLRWAAVTGFPRNASQTPYEFVSVLSPIFPEAHREILFITEQYVSARYGQNQPDKNQLRYLQESWHRLRQNKPGARKVEAKPN